MRPVSRLQPENQAENQAGNQADCQPQHAFIQVVGGVAARKRLHAVHPSQPGQQAAATGFALAMMLALERRANTPVLWVQDRAGAAESGRPYGLGLVALGLAPERLVVVEVKGAMDALAAAEMGLEEPGLAGVLVDLPPRLPADMLRLGKRLALRCEARHIPCFLLHAGREAVEMPVATRWQVASARWAGGQTARPDFTTAFDVELSKNRFGALGRWSVMWRRLPPRFTEVDTAVAHVSGAGDHDTEHFGSECFGSERIGSERFAFQPLRSSTAQSVVSDTANRPLGATSGAQPIPFRSAAA
jgi:protein ImuA